MINPFNGGAATSGPCSQTVDVDASKSDAAAPAGQLPTCIRAIYCGSTGNVRFHVLNDPPSKIYVIALVAGQIFDLFYIDQVFATGTSATGLIGGV